MIKYLWFVPLCLIFLVAATPQNPISSPFSIRKMSCFGSPEGNITCTFIAKVAGINDAVTCDITNPATSCVVTTFADIDSVNVECIGPRGLTDDGSVRCVIEKTLE